MATKPLRIDGISPVGKLSFPQLYVADYMSQNPKPGDEKKYAMTLAFNPEKLEGEDKENFAAMIDAANKCSIDFHKVPYKERIVDEDGTEHVIRSPFLLGKTSKYQDNDDIFIRMSTKKKPQIVDGNNDPISEESELIYSGCLVRASWTCTGYNHTGNHGVSFWLCNVQRVGAGERLNAGPKAEDQFSKRETDNDVSF